MTEVSMPKMGDGMEEGVLLEWLKKEGDKVKAGEPIATIQTDKATLEMEADGSGTLTGILVKPGETVPVGQPMAVLLADSEKVPEGWGSGAGQKAAKVDAQKSEAAPSKPAEPAMAVAASAAPQPSAKAPPEPSMQASAPPAPPPSVSTNGGRVKASPLARKIAEEMDVDISRIVGTGPGGRITEKDVRDAASGGAVQKPQGSDIPIPLAKPAAVAGAQGDQIIPLNKIRQITAQRTAESKSTVPHFYVTVEVDIERIQTLREQFEVEGAGKLSINDFVLKACAMALTEMPQVNATYQGDHLLQYGSVNIGMAVALQEGLTVPVIHGAQAMTLRQLSSAARDLATRARDNKLSMNELTGSTFSISNMGMLHVDNFAAIINAPNAAIVAVSTAKKIVVPVEEPEGDGSQVASRKSEDSEKSSGLFLEVRLRMNVTGSFDHRVVDGAVGAKFMNAVRDYLENPTRLLG